MTADTEHDRQHAIATLAEMIDGVSVFMLTTVVADGSLRSLPTARARTPFDGSVWLFADPSMPAIVALPTNPQVNLSFADIPACRYISLSCTIEAVHDSARARELWNPDYREWLPRGLHDPLHGLFRATVQHAEYWDAAHSVMRQIGGLMKGLFTGNRPAVGDHISIDLPTADAGGEQLHQ